MALRIGQIALRSGIERVELCAATRNINCSILLEYYLRYHLHRKAN